MNMITFLFALAGILAAAFALASFARARGSMLIDLPNIAEGTHAGGNVTMLTDAAVTLRFAVVKAGSDARHFVVTTANTEIPLGICTDEGTAAEDELNVTLLGATDGTVKMVASAAITAGAFVVCTAAGKIVTLPTSGGGTHYIIGRAITAAAADGDVIEVAPCLPTQRVVGA